MHPSPWDVLEPLCRGANDAIIVAPYIKVGALVRVLDLLRDEASLICVTRWTPLEIASGVSDVECRVAVTERGGDFRLHTRLHAKYYRFNNHVLIGSANMTSAGLGLSTASNFEILQEPSDSFDHHSFERQLLIESRQVPDDEFQWWSSLHLPQTTAQTHPPLPPSVETDDWKPATREPENVWLMYSDHPLQVISQDERRLALYDLQHLQVPPGLSRGEFNGWVRTRLLASPFVDSVLGLGNQRETDAWTLLAEVWNTTESQASRSMETANNWLAYYLPHLRSHLSYDK